MNTLQLQHEAIAVPNYIPAPSPKIRLRPYQESMRREVYSHIRAGTQRILGVVIMGAGKTYLSAAMIQDAVSRGHRCLFLVKLNVLIEQTLDSLHDFGIKATALQGQRKVDQDAPVMVASLQTIAARLRKGATLDELIGCPRFIVGDEAHILSFDSTYLKIEQYALEHGSTLLGLTATPWRRSRKQWLCQRYDALVEGPQPPEIIKMGNALPCRGFTIGGVLDLDELRVRQGEYVDGDIASQATRKEALNYIVSEWQRLCSGRPSMMVGATIAQAQATADAFNEAGITAEVIIGSTSDDERKAIFRRVQAAYTKVICSVGCLTAGFNLPCLSAVLYIRATKSQALFHQTAGRGSRPHPGKDDYILLDFGANLKRHGNPMGYQDYDIQEKPVPQFNSTKTCYECQAEIPIFARICPECGAEFCSDSNDHGDAEGESLEEILAKKMGEYGDKDFKEKSGFLRRARFDAYKHDRSPDEALQLFHDRYGHNPPMEWMRGAGLRHSRPNQRRRFAYLEYLERHCKLSKGSSDAWFQFHWSLEFGPGAQLMDASLFKHDWHEILGVDLSASMDDIKAAYRAALAATAETDVEAIASLNSALEDAQSS